MYMRGFFFFASQIKKTRETLFTHLGFRLLKIINLVMNINEIDDVRTARYSVLVRISFLAYYFFNFTLGMA